MRISACIAVLSVATIGGLMGASAVDHRAAVAAASLVPLAFEQASSGNIRWTARGSGYRLAVGPADVEIGLGQERLLRMQFVGANAKAPSEGLAPLPGKVNYLIGADPKGWLRGIPTYGRVRYKGVYPGVDVVWYGNQGQLEYDFVVDAGADPGRVRVRFRGARKLVLEPDGDVRIETAAGRMMLRLPEVYQEAAGTRQRVRGRYLLRAANEIGFELAAYDRSKPLVIDPTLVYGSYFGSGVTTITSIATDPQGNVYIGGYTQQVAAFPLVNAFQDGLIGNTNAFVVKFDPTGSTILYSTYIGGSNADHISGLTVDAAGEVIATGVTTSTDFPLVNAVQSQGNSTSGAVFAFKMSAAGNTLVYSTYLGSPNAVGDAVATDAAGNAYITGTAKAGFTTTQGAYQTTPGGGGSDAFVVKLGPAGNQIYSTLLGGAGTDTGAAIVADTQGNAYVAGATGSSAFPNSPPGARTANAGGVDAYVAKLTADGSAVTWLTFFGGSGDDRPTALVRDSASGTLYVAGSTSSPNLPTTAGTIEPSAPGAQAGFVASLAPDGMSFGFVTYLGGGKQTWINGMALDAAGRLALAGSTTSADFPSVNAVQPVFQGASVSLYKSTDLGKTWKAADTGLPAAISGIGVDPSNPATILAASMEDFSVFRTTNSGASWTAASGLLRTLSYETSPVTPAQFVRTPANPAVVYVCFPYGIAESPDGGTNTFVAMGSTDDGATWHTLGHPSSLDQLGAIFVSTADANTIVGSDRSGQLYRSTDGGATFTQIPGPFWGMLGPSSIAAGPNGSLVVVANSHGGLGFYPVYISPDFGLTWTPIWTLMGAAQLASSPSNPSVIYAYDGGISKSTDGGATWAAATAPPLNATILEVASDNPNVIVAAAYSQVTVSTDGGATWSTPASVPGYSLSALAVDSSGAVYVATPAVTDGFVAKLGTDGKALLWSTFYSGSGGSYPSATATAPSGDAWVAGYAPWSGLPVTVANPSASGGSFVARFSDAVPGCAYAVDPSSGIFYPDMVAGSESFTVVAPSGCAWTATPSDSGWITVSGGASGTGAGVVSLEVAANTTGSTRTGTVNVNGQPFTIIEPDASCTYSLAPEPLSVPSSGGTYPITVTAPAGCPWILTPQSPAITVVSGGSGTGNGTVTLSIAPNGSTQPVLNPSAALVGQYPLTLQQASACQYTVSPTTLSGAAGSGTLTITPNLAGCQWRASMFTNWISGSDVGTGPGSLTYTVNANYSPQRTATLGFADDSTGGLADGNTVTITQLSLGRQFVPVAPCRIADTRNPAGQFSGPSLDGVSSRTFAIPQSGCGVPSSAQAYSLNVTVVPQGMLEYLTLWPAGQTQPIVSTLNSWNGEVVANAAIVPAGDNGGVSVFAPNPTDVILDINGYFDTPSDSTSAFYVVPPCRLVDTRYPDGPLAGPALTADGSRDFPLLNGPCGLPSGVTAYSLNVTAVPDPAVNFLAFLTAWPTGRPRPLVSTLNSWTGKVVANAALVPSGTNGEVSVYAYDPTDVILDTNGYFAPAGQPAALSFYPVSPCRIVDTRSGLNSFQRPLQAGETDVFYISGFIPLPCGIPTVAQAYSMNVTVVPQGPLWYLTAWGAGEQPNVSTLNSWDGSVVANAAIVPAHPFNGTISVYVSNTTDVVLDINGFFAP